MGVQATFVRKRRPRAAVFAAAAVLAAGAAGGSAATGPVPELSAPSSSGFADLVERVQPAVVVVTVEKRSAAAAQQYTPPHSFRGMPEGMPHRFGPFFGRPPFGAPGPHRRTGAGSGFFVDAQGHIVTSDHVVAGAEAITVTLYDGARREARVVGRDPRTDLAVLKIDTGGVERPWLALGDESGTRVGDWVVAVGNPFGLGGTVTAGILSARGRDIRLGGYGDFLQVDAPINQGNSGGPLFDARGRVIGVNAAIFSAGGNGNVGIGFAVPASLAGPVVANLIEDGKVSRGWLGISIQALTPELARSLGMPGGTEDGALVAQVEPGSPADRAGLEEADVVLAVDGRPVENGAALARTIGSMKPGAGAILTVHRRGSPIEVGVDLAGWPDEGDLLARTAGERGPEPASGPRLGIVLSQEDGRLTIAEVRPDGPAADAGLVPGDVLLGIDHEPVQDRDGVRQALRKAAEDGREFALVRIERQGEPRFVAVRVEAA